MFVVFLFKYFLSFMHSRSPHASSGVSSVLYLSGEFSTSSSSSCVQCCTGAWWISLCVKPFFPFSIRLPRFHPAYTDASGEESHLQHSAIAKGLLHCAIFHLVFFQHLPTQCSMLERRAALWKCRHISSLARLCTVAWHECLELSDAAPLHTK